MKVTAERGDYLVFKREGITVKIYPEDPVEGEPASYDATTGSSSTRRRIKISRGIKTPSNKIPIRYTYATQMALISTNGHYGEVFFLDIEDLTENDVRVAKPVEKELCVDIPDELKDKPEGSALITRRLESIGFED